MSEIEDVSTDDALVALIKSNLITYATAVKENYRPARHHLLIGHYLDKVMKGEIKRLIIEAPPQHGKSELATQIFPAYFLGHNPDKGFIVGGYSQDKADDFGAATRNYIASEVHQAIFPNCKLDPSSNAKNDFKLLKGGSYIAAGVNGPVTGRGASGLILDDPYKNRKEADSDVINETLKTWWTSTFRSRLRGDGFIIIIQTRWNKRDLIQWLLDNEGDPNDPNISQEEKTDREKYKWHRLSFKALIEDEEDTKKDPLKREVGEVLWPEVFDSQVMRQMKKEVGTRDWNALYQQVPSDAKGEIYMREWFRYWCRKGCHVEHQHHPLPETFDAHAMVWDCAFKGKETSDFVVGLAGARSKGNLYILDRSKDRADITKTIKMITNFRAKHPDIMWTGIEDKANGPAVIDTMKGDVPGLVAMDAVDGKPARWHATAPAVESGNVYVPYGAWWVEDFIEVCASVPTGKYDDDADALAYLILKLLGKRLDGMLQWMKQQVDKMKNRAA